LLGHKIYSALNLNYFNELIVSRAEQDSTLVRFSFMTEVDLRTFRDGNSYVVDIVRDGGSRSTRLTSDGFRADPGAGGRSTRARDASALAREMPKPMGSESAAEMTPPADDRPAAPAGQAA
jgi:hypothetical protein